MTAKEKLREAVEELSEHQAAETLDYIANRRAGQRDALSVLLDGAPLDDEPSSSDEEEGVGEARGEIARGEIIPADEIRREFA